MTYCMQNQELEMFKIVGHSLKPRFFGGGKALEGRAPGVKRLNAFCCC